MSAYLLGNLAGRLALSYALLWLILFVLPARRQWRDAFRRTRHWTGLVSITTIFLIGLLAAQTHGAAP